MKFKVGDRVKVKSLSEIKNLPYHQVNSEGGIRGKCEDTDKFGNIITVHNAFIVSMFEFCGKEFVIEKVDEDGNYRLKNAFFWSFIACWLERTQHYVEFLDEE